MARVKYTKEQLAQGVAFMDNVSEVGQMSDLIANLSTTTRLTILENMPGFGDTNPMPPKGEKKVKKGAILIRATDPAILKKLAITDHVPTRAIRTRKGDRFSKLTDDDFAALKSGKKYIASTGRLMNMTPQMGVETEPEPTPVKVKKNKGTKSSGFASFCH